MDNFQKKLVDEIFEVTRKIQKNFPELYKNLSETPLFLSESEPQNAFIDPDFQQYLETLKSQLATFEQDALRNMAKSSSKSGKNSIIHA